MKNQKLNTGFGYETGQMREASKLSYTKEGKTSWFQVICYLLVSENVSFVKLSKAYFLFSLVEWCI